jgi:transposase
MPIRLEITDSGFDFSVLSEWRSRLIASERESKLLNKMLLRFQNKGWLKTRAKPELTRFMSEDKSKK